jgi:hypothetical protein
LIIQFLPCSKFEICWGISRYASVDDNDDDDDDNDDDDDDDVEDIEDEDKKSTKAETGSFSANNCAIDHELNRNQSSQIQIAGKMPKTNLTFENGDYILGV